MIEQGLVQLVQSTPAVAAICPLGGFFVELPKDQALPSWTYRIVFNRPNTTLRSVRGLYTMWLQIDCYSVDDQAVGAIRLANAIADVLDGYVGHLPDPDSTFVSACIPAEDGRGSDFFDDARRSYRRCLEYELLYAQD